MTGTSVRGVLLTQDAALRETILGASREAGAGFGVVLDLGVPLDEFSGVQVKSVRQAAPALVLIDLESHPALGLSLASHLASDDDLVVVALGHDISAELLLDAMRAGVAEFLPKPLTGQAFREALDRLRGRVAVNPVASGVNGKVYAFFSAKGGSGCTTITTNVAIAVHRATGKKCLLVDLDAELGEISLLLGVQPEFNFVDLVQNFHRMDTSLLASYIERHPSGVHLLSAPYHPDQAASLTADQVRQILNYLKTEYDYVFVDTSKSCGGPTLAVFERCDEAFVIATVDLPSLRNIQRALPLLLRVLPRAKDQVRLVINRYDPEQEIRMKDIEKSLGLPVYATLANDYEPVMNSINTGKPIVLGGRSPFAKDIKTMATRLIGAGEAEAAERTGFLSKLTGTFRTPRRSARPAEG